MVATIREAALGRNTLLRGDHSGDVLGDLGYDGVA
jgi:hypothetical protein